MLYAFRSGISSWFSKVLIIALAVSFSLWGIADVFFVDRPTDEIAQVGSTVISVREFQRLWSEKQNSLGGDFSENNPQNRSYTYTLQLVQDVLKVLIARAMLDEEARLLGIRVSDEHVNKAISSNSAFSDENGKFDHELAKKALRLAGFSPDEYVSSVRREIIRKQLIEATASVSFVPRILKEVAYQYINEKRTADVLSLDASSVDITSNPSETEIVGFYNNNKQLFATEETRKIAYAWIKKEDHSVDFSFIADSIDDYAAEGHSIKKITELLGIASPTINSVVKSTSSMDGIPPKHVSAVVNRIFRSPTGISSWFISPTENTLLLIDLINITPPGQPQLNDVRPEIIEALRKRHTDKKLETLAQKIAQQLREGKAAESIAESCGCEMKSIDPFRRGTIRDDFPVQAVAAAFSVPEGGVVTSRDGDKKLIMKITGSEVPFFVEGSREAIELENKLRESIELSIFEQLVQSLKLKYNPQINWKLIYRIIGIDIDPPIAS